MTIMQNKCTVSLNGAIIISLVSTLYLSWTLAYTAYRLTHTRIYVDARLILLAHVMCVCLFACLCGCELFEMKYRIYWAKLIIASLSLTPSHFYFLVGQKVFFPLFIFIPFCIVPLLFSILLLFFSYFAHSESKCDANAMKRDIDSIIHGKGEKTMKIKIKLKTKTSIKRSLSLTCKGCNLQLSQCTTFTAWVEYINVWSSARPPLLHRLHFATF